jgi:hypothetical protein
MMAHFPFVRPSSSRKWSNLCFNRSYNEGATLFVLMAHLLSVLFRMKLAITASCPNNILQLDVRIFRDDLQLSEHNLEVDDFVIAPLVKHQQRGVEVATQWRPHPHWRFLLSYAYDDITGL